MKNIIKTKWFVFGTYLLLVMATLLIGFVLLQNNRTLKNVITSFFEVAENRSFDYRQTLKIAHKQPVPNKDIVFLAIDDASLEMLWDKYGEWPIPRNVYADMINHIESQKPQAVIFDLMFIKSMRTTGEADNALINAMNSYDNIYTGMTFDNQPTDVRLPVELPERLKLNLVNNSDVKIKYSYTNCRPILKELINGKVNIGSTNAQRNSDGIIRAFSPIINYKEDYYPLLSFGAASKYVSSEVKNFTIDKDRNLLVGDTRIPLTKDGEAILNWYGKSGTHTVYPMFKLVKEMEANVHSLDFKDKVIIIGTSAMSLQDNKRKDYIPKCL